jgi:short-subunit dehydrogenase
LTLSAEEVAEQGYRAMQAGRRLVVPGLVNKIVTVLARLAPRALVLAFVDRHNRRR